MATRMKDIARELGLSTMTISKVIRNHPDIGEETRQRVKEKIKELRFTPNAAAQALVTGRSNVVGLIVPDLVHPFFAEVAKGISAELRGQSYSLVIASSEEDEEVEKKEIAHLLARNVDALIIASVQTSAESFGAIVERGTPFVLIDRTVSGLASNFVGIDDEVVGDLATEHLIEAGCRRIAYIGGTRVSSARGRLAGYTRTLKKHRMQAPENCVICRDHTDDLGDVTGYEAMREILGRPPYPDGVFCYNDTTAMGAMLAILDAGLRIPDDIALVGSGDVHYGRFLRVPLSSVAQQSELLGKKAGKLALGLVGSNIPNKPKTILMKPKLVVRASSNRKAET